MSVSPSSIVEGTGGDTRIRCSFTGLNLADYNVRWRVNESDLSLNETLMQNYLTRREGNTEVLIFRKSVWSLSGSYSCELMEYSTIRSFDVSVSIEPGMASIVYKTATNTLGAVRHPHTSSSCRPCNIIVGIVRSMYDG